MSRPLRIEFAGAVYHVTSRGDRREPIYGDDEDRRAQLGVVAQALARFDAQMLAYCQMGNHYHFVLYTRQANRSQLMRHLNGVYTQLFNRRHGKVGHVFQGRFKAILVDRDAYLLAVCRYVELNPVRAGMVRHPQDWPWSSYRAHVGLVPPPAWLDVAGLQGHVLGRPAHTARDQQLAARRYQQLVLSAPDLRLWEEGLRQQIYLGDDDFVLRMQAHATDADIRSAREVPKVQRRQPMMSLAQWLEAESSRERGLYRAHTEGGMTMTAIAQELGLSVSRVSRLISSAEKLRAPVKQGHRGSDQVQ